MGTQSRPLVKSKHRGSILVPFAVLWMMAVVGAADAQEVLTVTNTVDRASGACGSDCTLREAILAANAEPGGNKVTVAPGLYALMLVGENEDDGLTGDLDVRDSVVIQGAGVDATIVDGQGLDRVFHIIGSEDLVVELRDLTIQHGHVQGPYPSGGGGLLNSGTQLTLTNVRITENRYDGEGLGVGGGGLATLYGVTHVDKCSIDNNVYTGHLAEGGAGLFFQFGTALIRQSTIANNISHGRGGGVMNLAGDLTIINSTVSGNQALGDGGIYKVAGGGVWTDDGTTAISFSTITDNFSSDGIGGVGHDGTRVDLFANIIAENTVGPGALGPDCLEGPYFEHMISGGSNLIGDASDCATFTLHAQPTDLVGTASAPLDPQLLPLAENGGPTLTHALKSQSPALDRVDTEDCPPLDQRGYPRPFGDAGDIGAFELSNATISGAVNDSLGNALAGTALTLSGGADTYVVQSGADGTYAASVAPGTYTISASLPGYTFSPAVEVTVLPDAVGVDFTGYDRSPVVLVAGFSSAYGTAFPPVPTALEQAGYHVSEADIVNLSDGTVPEMEKNAVILLKAIDAAKRQTGQSQVILVAHSMGGLVSRAYVEGPSYPARRDVAQLFTFGTPHLGIPALWADIVPALASGLTAGTLNQGTVCTWLPGFCQMSKANMVLFNTLYRRTPGIDYHAVGGDAPLGHKKTIKIFGIKVKIPVPDRTWHNALGLTFSMLIPGADDAFIETYSSVGLDGLYVDLFRTSEVHDPALGHRAYFKHDGGESQQSYVLCLEPVLVTKTTRTCGARKAPLPPASLTSSLVLAAEEPTDSDEVWDYKHHSALQRAQVLPDEPQEREVFVPAGTVTFVALSSGESPQLSLIDPDGAVISPNSADGELIQYDVEAGSASFTLARAKAGSYRMVLTPATGAGATEVTTFAAFDSPTELTLALPHPERPWYPAGQRLELTATLTPSAVAADLLATLTFADGSVQTVPLEPDFNGNYAAYPTLPAAPGMARITVEARGEADNGTAFELAVEDNLLVMADGLTLSGQGAEQLIGRTDGGPRYEALEVALDLAQSSTGPLQASADLVSADGAVVSHATTALSDPGTAQVTLRFPGEAIFAAAHDGPFVVTHLLLLDGSSAPAVPALDADAVYTTQPYDHLIFAPQEDAPVFVASGPYSVFEGEAAQLRAKVEDPEGDAVNLTWDVNGDGQADASGEAITFDARAMDGPMLVPLTLVATDGDGHSSTAQTSVDVLNAAPVLSAVPAQVVGAGQNLVLSGLPFADPGLADTHHAEIDWGDASPLMPVTVSQAAGGGTLAASHSYAKADLYEATLCVLDDDGASDCRHFEVDVQGAPECSDAYPSRDTLWPPNGGLHDVQVLGIVSAAGEPLLAHFTRITQDEPVVAKGERSTAPDASGLGDSTAQIRAERSGKGNGRVYHLFFTASDKNGLSCDGQVHVSVPHDANHPAIDDGVEYDSTGSGDRSGR